MTGPGRLLRAAVFAADLGARVARLAAAAVVDLTRPRARLTAENTVLRAQVALLKRKVGRATPAPADRLLLAGLWHLAPDAALAALHAVRPETVIRWHADAGRWLHAWRSRRSTRQSPRSTTPDATRDLVVDMAEKNPRWGAPRIQGELAKLEVTLALETVQRILRRRWPDGRPRPGQSWETFVRNHLPGTWACDLFTVTTQRFRQLHVLFFVRLDTREVVLANVTDRPTAAWAVQQLRNALWDDAPERLIRDRDTKFTRAFDELVESGGGEVLLCPPRAPRCNAFAERLVGTFRRELFDHVVPRDEEHVRALISEFLAHYHAERAHQGLGQRTPRAVRAGPGGRSSAARTNAVDPSTIVIRPVLNGLIHEFRRRGAA